MLHHLKYRQTYFPSQSHQTHLDSSLNAWQQSRQAYVQPQHLGNLVLFHPLLRAITYLTEEHFLYQLMSVSLCVNVLEIGRASCRARLEVADGATCVGTKSES